MTFEEWWAMRTQYGTENKELARDAWFGAAKLYAQTADEYEAVMREFVSAFDSRWDGESERKRSNAISPRMEDAIAAIRKKLP